MASLFSILQTLRLNIILQAVTDKVTATTLQFRFVNPTDTGGLPIEAYAVEYKEAMQNWNEARRRVWPQSRFYDTLFDTSNV